MAIPSNVTMGPAPRVSRAGRRPQHSFQVRHAPWAITPFLIAPVLPGDTLKNLLLQARAVSQPVKNPLIGWWLEYYFFYVPHRSMEVFGSLDTDLQAMMLNPEHVLAAENIADATDAEFYTFGLGVDYVKGCLRQVVDEFFRDEDEAWNAGTMGNYPAAQLNNTNWAHSLMSQAEYETNLPIDVDVEGADANTTIQLSEIRAAERQWLLLAQAGLTDQTYEDFLRTYGVRVPDRETVIKPELIRYVREWTYPSNTINSSTGTPTSALSWSIAERADKDRFFKEPGFIFGCTVARPKVYYSKQVGAAVGMMDNVFSWLPAVLGDDPSVSMKWFDAAAGISPNITTTGGYWVDIKDLFMYGDQFVNFALTETDAGMVAVPKTTAERKYPAGTDMDALFVGSTAATRQVRQDGVVSLNILSRVVDTSAKT